METKHFGNSDRELKILMVEDLDLLVKNMEFRLERFTEKNPDISIVFSSTDKQGEAFDALQKGGFDIWFLDNNIGASLTVEQILKRLLRRPPHILPYLVNIHSSDFVGALNISQTCKELEIQNIFSRNRLSTDELFDLLNLALQNKYKEGRKKHGY